MLCDRCGTRPVARILTQVVDGEKKTLYRCEACAQRNDGDTASGLERPCDRCGEREGRIKLTRIKDQYKTVEFLCDVCATQR
ncbi:MAG: hypothetical protein QGI83_23320 [Candidatus Latescibacteria bacterium]|nr:hypothetical protein [Candidatus Latescibacterota bacterium]